MPASYPVDYGRHDELTLQIKPKENKKVFFVGESPEFLLTIKNNTAKYIGEQERHSRTQESKLNIELGWGSTTPEHFRKEEIEFSVKAKEKKTIKINLGYLSAQGNGIIMIRGADKPVFSEVDSGSYYTNPPGGNISTYEELYSFTIWDEDFYDLHYNEPKELQSSAVRLSRYVVYLAIIQIFLILSQLSLLIYQIVS